MRICQCHLFLHTWRLRRSLRIREEFLSNSHRLGSPLLSVFATKNHGMKLLLINIPFSILEMPCKFGRFQSRNGLYFQLKDSKSIWFWSLIECVSIRLLKKCYELTIDLCYTNISSVCLICKSKANGNASVFMSKSSIPLVSPFWSNYNLKFHLKMQI